MDTSVLGRPAEIPVDPTNAVLDRVPNPHPDIDYLIRFTVPEFTALCPITGQPDFAHLVIDYVADQWMIESKSLKLFMFSYRNHGAFHEATTVEIAKRLVEALAPRWLRIGGYWYPRGGIPIDVFWQTGARRPTCGCPNRACPAIAAAAEAGRLSGGRAVPLWSRRKRSGRCLRTRFHYVTPS